MAEGVNIFSIYEKTVHIEEAGFDGRETEGVLLDLSICKVLR